MNKEPATVRAITVSSFGGPEVLRSVEIDAPIAGEGELRIGVAAAGVNFRDLLHRAGKFGATVPFVPGCEGAGTVLDVGGGVSGFSPGDRVAWKQGPSYAEQVVVNASETVRLPEGLSFEQAAASCLQGLTAQFLTTATYPVVPGTTALVHAGAGGVGRLLVQMVKRRGGSVIATVSTQEKAEVASAAGADQVIVIDDGDSSGQIASSATGGGAVGGLSRGDRGVSPIDPALSATIRELAGGDGVDVVYDGVGLTTFDVSLASCRTRGMLVLFGGSSGNVPPFDIMRLMTSGSITLARPSVRDFSANRLEFDARSSELFSMIFDGSLDVLVSRRYPLEDAAAAQIALESRQSVGKLLLIP